MGMVSTDHFFWDSDFDEYSEYSSRRLICCRIVAILVLSLFFTIFFAYFSFAYIYMVGFINCKIDGGNLGDLLCMQFTVLLVLRHTLPIIISCAGEYSPELFMVKLQLLSLLGKKNKAVNYSLVFFFWLLQLLTFRIIGILLPIYIIVKAFTAVQRGRSRQNQVR